MTFEEEWAALKAGAGDGSRVHTRLNGPLPPDGAGPGLKVSASVLRAKAEATDKIARRFMATDNEAMTETRQIKGSLSGFACASAFDTFDERWARQMKYVREVLETRTADSLRKAAKLFKKNDLDTGNSFWRQPGPWKDGPNFG
ncbi:hypothetical protein [Streptomyces iconiensis]|uniref:Excreted virulence factor EspC, type VII ESX diderm n=1 Tax=Streptomyces iconiensis TaxID=1384038 RepID=A0ABT6ZVZ8_9ACTN|nr:hypothetical protein [Streptomyces iconiensis]MDJ1133250.1 hypothetical protein [Streptomyces iconiensis]